MQADPEKREIYDNFDRNPGSAAHWSNSRMAVQPWLGNLSQWCSRPYSVDTSHPASAESDLVRLLRAFSELLYARIAAP